MGHLELPVIVAACIALLGPFIIRPVLERAQIVDSPNARSSHSTPILRGAGLTQLVAVTIGLLWVGIATSSVQVLVVGLIAALASILGFADDIRGLPASRRFGLQLLIGGGVVVGLQTLIGSTWWVAIIGALVVVTYINMSNFMDGINGISSIHGGVVGGVFAFVGLATETEWLSVVGGILSLAYLAFLPWNFLGKRMFLGDCGSYLLGSLIGITAACAIADGVPWQAALAPMAVYVTDTGSTIVRRIRRGNRLSEAHREHLYQQLVDSGARHFTVALFVGLCTLLAALGGLLSLEPGSSGGLWAELAVLMTCVVYWGLARVTIGHLRRRNQ